MFNIQHSFDHHFVALLDKLEKKYGEEMFELEGIDRKNLDIAKFTNKFLETKVTADVSVDANANVDDTSVLSWDYEMPKPLMKLNGLYFLWKDALKKHGIKRANKMIELEIAGGIRIHDLHGWLKPYSYYRETPIYIRVNGCNVKCVTMKQLFDMYAEYKVVLSDREFIDLTNVKKYIGYENTQIKHKSTIRHQYDEKNTVDFSIFEKHNIEILDGDGNWTKLQQVLRHKRNTNMVAYQLENGDYSVVTTNHPVILADGTEIQAENLQIGMEIKAGNKDIFKNITTEYIDVPTDFAYFIGFITGDGNVGRHKFNSNNYNLMDNDLCINVTEYEGGITIYQKNIANTKIYKCVKNLLGDEELTRKSVKRDGTRISFNNRTIRTLMAKYFGVDYTNNSATKNIPINILSWTKEAKAAFIAGLIDAEGSVWPRASVDIRMKAYAVMNMLQEVLLSIGIQSTKRFTGKSFENFYGIGFQANELIKSFSSKLENVEIEPKNKDPYIRSYKVKKIDIFNPDTDIHLGYNLSEEESEFYYVYDITTISHTFYSGGMTQHNCWGTSLSTIVNEGMPWVKRIKIGPIKHFYSFINNTFQLICTLSTQCVGAVAVPDFLIYAEYFIRKDFGDKWYEDEKTVSFIRQAFQHFIYSVNNSFRGNQSLTYDETIVVNGKSIPIGEYVERLLPNDKFEAPVLDTDYTFTLNRETGKLEVNRIKGVIKHKTANKIVKYVLSNGATIKATDNHSFFTRNGLEIEEIQRNSNPTNLLVPFNFAKEDKDISVLPVIQTVGKKEAIDIPLTENYMYFLGQYLGDGLYNYSSINIATCDDYANAVITEAVPEYTYSIKSDNSIRLNVGRNIADAIKSVFNTGSYKKVLPRDWVNKKNILHLIGGYIDADGFAPTDGYKGFVLTSVNKNLLESVQFILMGYGIFSTLKKKEHKGFNNKEFTVYRLTISAVGSHILNQYTRIKKVKEISNQIDSSKLFVDYKGIINLLTTNDKITKTELKKYCTANSIDYDNCGIIDIQNIIKNFNSESISKLKKFITAIPVKIVNIEECEQEEFVYDISVENNENFLTGSNIYAHNSPFTNVSVYDKYWLESLFKDHMNPDFTHPDLDNAMRVQKLFVDELMNQLQNNPFTFPVMTAASLLDPETREFKDQEWLDWLSEVSVKNKCLNFFQDNSTSSISSCCRLKNELSTIGKDGKQEYVNSFGVGGISIGSHRVVCVNLPQIAYIAKYSEKDDWNSFFNILESRIKIAQDILDIHKELLERLIKNGNLPMYTYGVMNLNKQYSTLGFIGLYEALEIMGLDVRTDEGLDMGKKILGLFNKLNTERTSKDGRIRNLEQIPGESAAVTFALKDKLQFANAGDYDLYANQYLPLIKEALLTDRIRLQGEFDKGTSGGAILHADFDTNLTKDQIKNILSAFAKAGVIYGAIDDCQVQCKNCGKVYVGKPNTIKSKCCNSDVEIWMRVVGFKTPKRSYNKVRRTQDLPRRFCYEDGPAA